VLKGVSKRSEQGTKTGKRGGETEKRVVLRRQNLPTNREQARGQVQARLGAYRVRRINLEQMSSAYLSGKKYYGKQVLVL